MNLSHIFLYVIEFLEERTAELETVEEISEGGFDRDSYQGEREEDGEREGEEIDQEDDHEKEFEMLQTTPEPEEFLTPEEREERRLEQEKMDKKQKVKQICITNNRIIQ